MRETRRLRATIVAVLDRKVLLVMEKGSSKFSLPGGGVRRNEPSIAAAIRELYEETGLNCSNIEWQFYYDGRVNSHRVFLASPTGTAYLKSREITKLIWWDGIKTIPLETHVQEILSYIDWRDYA